MAGDIAPFEPFGPQRVVPPQALPPAAALYAAAEATERLRPPLQRGVADSTAMHVDDSAVDLGEHRPPPLLNAQDMATAELRCGICLELPASPMMLRCEHLFWCADSVP